MKTLILTFIVALSLGSTLSYAQAQSLAYTTPSHNYYQNNWMRG